MNTRSFILVVIIFSIILVAVFFFIRTAPVEEASTSADEEANQSSQIETREEALEQARNFRPEGACTQVITPAVHEVTGVQYEFPSGCLPDGWIRDRSGI